MTPIDRRSALPFALLLVAAMTFAGACATAPAPSTTPPQEPAAAPPAEAAEPAPAATPDPAPPADEPPAAEAAADAAGRTLCWATEEEVTLVVGQSPPGARRVLRMTTRPDAGVVEHQALRIDPNPQVPPRLFEVDWAVEGDRFTIVDEDAKLSGTGTLAGETWAWTGWSSDTLLASGIRVAEEAELREDGVLVIDRRVFGPDGGAVMTLHEEGEPLTAEECERRLAEASGP